MLVISDVNCCSAAKMADASPLPACGLGVRAGDDAMTSCAAASSAFLSFLVPNGSPVVLRLAMAQRISGRWPTDVPSTEKV
jgi:hypothetical protein